MQPLTCPNCGHALTAGAIEDGICPACASRGRPRRDSIWSWIAFGMFLVGALVLGWFAAAAFRGEFKGPLAILAMVGAFALSVAAVFERRAR